MRSNRDQTLDCQGCKPPYTIKDMLVHFGVPAISLSTSLYFIELLQNYFHTSSGKSAASSIIPSRKSVGTWSPLVWASVVPILRGYRYATQSSLMRTPVTVNREHVHNHVTTVIGEKEKVIRDECEEISYKKSFGTTLVTANIMAFADSLITQVPGNKRLLSEKNLLNAENYRIIFPKTGTMFGFLKQCLQFGFLGWPMRYTKNFTNSFLFLSSERLIKDGITAYFPNANSELWSTVLAGTMSGVLTNPMEIIYKNQVTNANLLNFSTNSIWATTNKLYQTNGMRFFLRGSPISVLYSTAAYSVLKLVEKELRIYDENRMLNYVPSPEPQPKSTLKDRVFGFFRSDPIPKDSIINDRNKPKPS